MNFALALELALVFAFALEFALALVFDLSLKTYLFMRSVTEWFIFGSAAST